jgi:hypothetical protein
MSRAQLLYPDAKEGSYAPFCDYDPIIENFGEVLVRVDDNNYHGDSRVLYHRDGRYGLFVFGWGSCSGCDSLRACKTFADVAQLIDELEDDIKWFDTLSELKTYVADDELQSGSYHYHCKEWQAFRKAVAEWAEVV